MVYIVTKTNKKKLRNSKALPTLNKVTDHLVKIYLLSCVDASNARAYIIRKYS